ncbi:hypothetical protein [uncultured Draconibacterium sp.]|uniref:hypothetical protein n=1 Tax=uncultured Draconibacterium sp. TaxID=1573823 RepID=UPI0025F24580|nr:hypothetical protein [uncultured Draconibacterium sp.]
MDIKKIVTLLLVVLVGLACEEYEAEVYSNQDGRFIRFQLVVNNDGQPVEEGTLVQNADIAKSINYAQKQALKIPVSLTSEPLVNNVTATFSTNVSGSFSAFEITPTETLNFSGKKLNDTITINFNERWFKDDNNSIKLKLESVSDNGIALGFPNPSDPYNELTISLDELALTYKMQDENMLLLNGDMGEEVFFDVLFPEGFFVNEVAGVELVNEVRSDFDYSIEQHEINEDENKVTYKLTLNESLDVDIFSYTAKIELNDLEYYKIAGNSSITFVKPENVDRDLELNTAAYFYNLSDPFYRTYGETWMDYNKDGECDWTAWNVFTYPVVVDASHPDAILYDDNGTSNPDDDIYHHAFRIGFNSPNAGRTTNSFNLKRILDNEYTDADKSPGFNVPQALEFYPADGTSASNGFVKVVAQEIILSNKEDKSYQIAIEGEGTYTDIGNGIFKIEFEFRMTNAELFGGTTSRKFLLYNTKEYDDPAPLTEECHKPVDM